ncbi:hypothetical protein B0H14DRAFT_2836660 [Mycena olivaceomarginata]|nr:hypothetical protein B0H14DRAFT_2836660 [Mycena olivaceomarginata]
MWTRPRLRRHRCVSRTRSPTIPVPPRPGGSRPRSPAPPLREGSSSKYEYYAAYDSPFECYPLLRLRASSGATPKSAQASHSHSPTTACSSSSLSSSSSSSISSLASFSSSPSLSTSTYNSVFPLPSLKPLLLATSSGLDPDKRICQYEVPGGGVCRDAGCEDLHLNRVGREGGAGVVEPSGTWSGIVCLLWFIYLQMWTRRSTCTTRCRRGG